MASHEQIALNGLLGETDFPDPHPRPEPSGPRPEGGAALSALFVALRKDQIRYCILRDSEPSAPGSCRLDLLVDPSDLARLHGLLATHGFLPTLFRRRPRHAFVAYDGEGDVWWHLHVTTPALLELSSSALCDLGRTCLARRRHQHPWFVPSPEDEIVAILLRCVLDPAPISSFRRDQLQQLAQRVRDRAHLEALLDMLWLPRTDVRALLRQIQDGDWTMLLARRCEVAERLASRTPVRARLGRWGDRLLRPLERRLRRVVPGAPAVAVLAARGAHPSSLGTDLARHLRGEVHHMEVELRGESGAGSRLLDLARWWGRSLRARWHRRRGRFVILDGYPLATRPTPGASWQQRLVGFVLDGLGPRPDLFLVLASPAALADRRPELPAGQTDPLPRHRRFRRLRRRSESVLLDSSLDPESLRRQALARVWGVALRRRREAVR